MHGIAGGLTLTLAATGVLAQPSYDRTELPRWREFQAQVTAFLTRATSDPS